MHEYNPDSWKIVEMSSGEHGKIYKVLASWYGGFKDRLEKSGAGTIRVLDWKEFLEQR